MFSFSQPSSEGWDFFFRLFSALPMTWKFVVGGLAITFYLAYLKMKSVKSSPTLSRGQETVSLSIRTTDQGVRLDDPSGNKKRDLSDVVNEMERFLNK